MESSFRQAVRQRFGMTFHVELFNREAVLITTGAPEAAPQAA